MLLSIQTRMLPGTALAEKFENAAAFGFDAVEVQINPTFDLKPNMDEIIRAQKACALPISDICTHPMHDPIVPDPKERQERLKKLAEIVQLCDELGGRGVVFVPYRPPHVFPDLAPWKTPNELIRELTVRVMKDWLEALPAGNAKLFVEPLNRFETRFLVKLSQGLQLCEEINHPRVRLLADFYHMNFEENNLYDPILQARDYLAMVHLADNQRYQPGTGCLNFQLGFKALKEIGYQGYCSYECFAIGGGNPILGDPYKALPESVKYVRRVWAEA